MQELYELQEVKWENSLEGILSQLDIVGTSPSANIKDEIFIVKTLLRLPEDVRNKVLKEVSFIILYAKSTTVKKCLHILFDKKDLKSSSTKERYITAFKRTFIVFNFTHLTDWDKMDIIAHEISHFILGHENSQYYSRDGEKKVEDLIKKWGFRLKRNFTVINKIDT
jgi:hypothetical protein